MKATYSQAEKNAAWRENDTVKLHEQFCELVRADNTRSAAAKALGFADWAPLCARFRRHGLPIDVVKEAPRTERDHRTLKAKEALVSERIARYAKTAGGTSDQAVKRLHIPTRGPFGVLMIGDPHLDDDGTDLALLQRHMDLVNQTDGAYAACVGDVTNNWVGKLARLYAHQSTTAKEAWMLAEWFFEYMGDKMLFVVGGNHDLWSGDSDPLQWIAAHVDVDYVPHNLIAHLVTPGQKGGPITINMRHSFKGNSMWNTAHGMMKAAQLGTCHDLLVAGHTHCSGFGIVKNQTTGKLVHCLQVASYKINDDYPVELGLRDQFISPSAFVIFDPTNTGPGRVQVFHDIDVGVKCLSAIRAQEAA